MRKFLISAAIACLVGGTSLAMAQDQDHRGGGDNKSHGQDRGGGRGGEPGGRPQAGAPAAPNPGAGNGRNAIGQRDTREHHDAPSPPAATQQAPAPNAMRGNPGRQDNNRPAFNRGTNGQNFDRNNANGNQGRPDNNRSNFNRPNSNGFNNGLRGGQRHDFSNFRNFHQNFRAQQRFRAPSYRRPPGYYARRWGWGQVLPSFFWTRDYWLTDYYDYDLPPPPFGAIWVRVGDDALLIDQDSGEIIEVDYGVFY
jgi:Ni/Co efflux regulator RcnB